MRPIQVKEVVMEVDRLCSCRYVCTTCKSLWIKASAK